MLFTFTPLVPKSPENVNQLNTILQQAQTSINSVDETQLAQSVLQAAGLNSGAQVGRGKSINPGSEFITSTSYTMMPTPDRVSNLVLPADGLITVLFQARWYESVLGAARAAVFIGSNQLVSATSKTTGPVAQEAQIGGTAVPSQVVLSTFAGGLVSPTSPTSGDYQGDVTTGQVVGSLAGYGAFQMFAAAGTYSVSVQFKASSGTVTANSRKLWVKAEAF